MLSGLQNLIVGKYTRLRWRKSVLSWRIMTYRSHEARQVFGSLSTNQIAIGYNLLLRIISTCVNNTNRKKQKVYYISIWTIETIFSCLLILDGNEACGLLSLENLCADRNPSALIGICILDTISSFHFIYQLSNNLFSVQFASSYEVFFFFFPYPWQMWPITPPFLWTSATRSRHS